MEPWGVAFLGVIALSALVQVAALAALLVLGLRLSRRLTAVQTRLDRDLSPALADLARAGRSIGEVADLERSRRRRLERTLGDTVHHVSDAAALVHRLVGTFRAAGSAVALVLALRRGLKLLRR